MRLERLTLVNFRSYKNQVFHFGQTSVIVAPNGGGKSNILEAISFLSSGKSERAAEISEMITFDSELASVTGVVEHNDERSELAIVLTRGMYMGKMTPKRRYLVDGVARTRGMISNKLLTVLFRPEDMRLIEGSPVRRRGYLDSILCMVHPEYERALSVYEASLRRRNRLLDSIREGQAGREQLTYWDQSIIKNGNILSDFRRELLLYLSQIKTSFGQYNLEYTASTISPARLAQHAQAEIAVGYTLVGPHKDDFKIMVYSTWHMAHGGDRDLMKYGSRGEQRLAVLFLKLGNLQYIEEKLGVKPILLLDDIFSELDEGHRKEVAGMMEGRQAIVTSAEPAVALAMAGLGRVDIIRL